LLKRVNWAKREFQHESVVRGAETKKSKKSQAKKKWGRKGEEKRAKGRKDACRSGGMKVGETDKASI